LLIAAVFVSGCDFFTSVQVAPGKTYDFLLVKYNPTDTPSVLIFYKKHAPGTAGLGDGWDLIDDKRGDAREAVSAGNDLLIFYETVAGRYVFHDGDEKKSKEPALERTVISLPQDISVLEAAAMAGDTAFLIGKDNKGRTLLVKARLEGDVFKVEERQEVPGVPQEVGRAAVTIKNDTTYLVFSQRGMADVPLVCYRAKEGSVVERLSDPPLMASAAWDIHAGDDGLLLIGRVRGKKDSLFTTVLGAGDTWSTPSEAVVNWDRFIFSFNAFRFFEYDSRLYLATTNTQSIIFLEHKGASWNVAGSPSLGLEGLMEVFFIVVIYLAAAVTVLGVAFVWKAVRRSKRLMTGAGPIPAVKARVAPFTQRLAAYAADIAFILPAIMFMWGTLVKIPADTMNAFWHLRARDVVMMPLIEQGIIVAYFMLFELLLGRTPGKMLMKLDIVTADGQSPGPWRIVLRNLVRVFDACPSWYVPMIGAVSLGMDRDGQRVGDIAAGTYVILKVPAPVHETASEDSFVDLVLASGSSTRAELLRKQGLRFRRVSPDIVEPPPERNEPADEYVIRLAVLKNEEARHLNEFEPGSVVLTADTVVEVAGEIIGKPKDRDDARRILKLLTRLPHRVITGVCLVRVPDGKMLTAVDAARLELKMSDEEIERYLDTREWEGRSGAYAIQVQDPHVKFLGGERSTVEGLPMHIVMDMLKEIREA
jgi:septum formation protein